VSRWFQPLPPEHPPDLPGDLPNRRWLSPLPRLRELRRDSRQRDIRPREPSRQHESRLLIRVGWRTAKTPAITRRLRIISAPRPWPPPIPGACWLRLSGRC